MSVLRFFLPGFRVVSTDVIAGKRALAFDLHTAAAQAPQNATWVQAEHRWPTERCRSEGTPTKEEPNQEPGHLVTWCLFK
jgi:hypothetical protein